jgi:hypothetical protein
LAALIASQMTRKSLQDTKHWRDRAEQARIQAEQMSDPESRRRMLQVAEDYERMADQSGRPDGVRASSKGHSG